MSEQGGATLVLRWVEGRAREVVSAMQEHDASRLANMASTPFYFDGQVLSSKAAIRQAYMRMFPRKRSARLEGMTATTAGDLLASDPEGRMGAVGLSQDDALVVSLMGDNVRKEAVIFAFRRAKGAPKFVGWWHGP
jgi:hypothetical protein